MTKSRFYGHPLYSYPNLSFVSGGPQKARLLHESTVRKNLDFWKAWFGKQKGIWFLENLGLEVNEIWDGRP